MPQLSDSAFEDIDLLNRVLAQIKESFVGKDDIIDLMGICLVGRENLFLLGPPGTAKSAMVKELGKLLKGKTFEYLLTRFTEPNELFGPFDIRKLREGELVTNTEGMLPEATLIFLDELLNANSAILNSLLMVLNEKVFRRGKETRDLPVLMIVGASNHLPEDEALQALFDRFLLRVRCDNIDPKMLSEVLQAGWQLEKNQGQDKISIDAKTVARIQQQIYEVNLENIRPVYIGLIQQLRNAGIKVSDRRAVKLQRLIAASALLCKRKTAILSDMWVMRFIWDTEEQREVIASMIKTIVDTDPEKTQRHPRASKEDLPNPDEIYQEVIHMTQQWESDDLSMADKNVLKDRLRYLNGRSEWITNTVQREYVIKPIEELWQRIIEKG